MRTPRRLILSVFTPVLAFIVTPLCAQLPQARGGPGSELIHQGTQLDLQGKGDEARAVFQKAIDSAPTPAAKANAQRAMAMSWAFDGNCKKTAAV